jgi:uncharacterized protein YcsI (UPF0317 family)
MAVVALERSVERPLTDPREAGGAARRGNLTGQTAGFAPGYVQANLVILPKDYALDFLTFCQRNPKPCPLLGTSEPGEPTLPMLAEDLDVRTDLPAYRVFRDGELVEEIHDVSDLWRDDFVIFALGCSFSFEEALAEAGLELRHWTTNTLVPMYLTDIDTAAAGRFGGRMVVSMRPFRPADAIRAIQVTSRFPAVHGAPVHIGRPDLIGIEDIRKAWQGDDPLIHDDELPLFWACGVTPQVAVRRARPPICITHKPGHMLVTDLLNASLACM